MVKVVMVAFVVNGSAYVGSADLRFLAPLQQHGGNFSSIKLAEYFRNPEHLVTLVYSK